MKEDADVDATDNSRYSALIWASMNGHEEIAKMLLDKNEMMQESRSGNEKAVKVLLEKGVNINL